MMKDITEKQIIVHSENIHLKIKKEIKVFCRNPFFFVEICIIDSKNRGDISMRKSKIINFNFFRPTTFVEGRNRYLSLTELFEQIRLRYQRAQEENETDYKVIYSYNDEPARIASITVDPESGIYHLIFERLVYNLPNKTTLHGESTAVELDEEEYIGHDVSVLYDSHNHIIMIQRNRDSLSPNGIESCLNTLVINNGICENFDMAIITDPNAKRKAFQQHAYRKVHMKVSGAKANGIVEQFSNIIGGGNGDDPNIDNIEIVFNSGTKRDDEIDNSYAKRLLEEYIDDDDVKTLKVRGRSEDGQRVETIDLIDHKVQVFDTISIDENRQINPYRIYEIMLELYNGEDNGILPDILGM